MKSWRSYFLPVVKIAFIVSAVVVMPIVLYQARSWVAYPEKPLSDETFRTEEPLVFTSSSLGVTFQYAEWDGNQEMVAKEVAQKIYLYPINRQPHEGISLEVFTKPAAVSLSEAIQTQVLKGFSSENCEVVLSPFIHPPKLDWEIATIQYRHLSPGGFPRDEHQCPSVYTSSTSPQSVYEGELFVMDRRVPTRFVYISTSGQYTLDPDSIKLVLETLEIAPN